MVWTCLDCIKLAGGKRKQQKHMSWLLADTKQAKTKRDRNFKITGVAGCLFSIVGVLTLNPKPYSKIQNINIPRVCRTNGLQNTPQENGFRVKGDRRPLDTLNNVRTT